MFLFVIIRFNFLSFLPTPIILMSNFFKKYNEDMLNMWLFNGYEDIDLTINLLEKGIQINFVDYKIGDYSGKSLGTSLDRSAREIANLAYFNSKHPNLEKAIEKSEKMID